MTSQEIKEAFVQALKDRPPGNQDITVYWFEISEKIAKTLKGRTYGHFHQYLSEDRSCIRSEVLLYQPAGPKVIVVRNWDIPLSPHGLTVSEFQ